MREVAAMREMKDSGSEWVGRIPSDWEMMRGKDIFYQVTNKGNNKNLVLLSPTQNYGVIPQELYEELSGFSAVKLNEKTDLNLLKTVHKGAFVISLRSFQGGFEYSEYEGVVSPAYQVFYPHIDIVDGYYKYLFKDKSFIEKMNSYTLSLRDGKNIAFADFASTYIPFPPIEEQEKISKLIESKCSEIDLLLSDILSEIVVLETYKKSVITETVMNGLDKNVPMKKSGIEWVGDVPDSWKMQRGKYVFEQRSDRGNDKSLILLSPTQNYGVIPQELYEELSGFSAVKLNEKTDLNALKTVHKGAFVISLRSFQGGFEYSEYEGVISPAYQVFYPTIPICDGYYKYLFKTQAFIDKMNSYTMSLRDGKNIAFADFGRTYIPVPPVEEQERIAEFLNKKCDDINDIITKKQEQFSILSDYRKSLIYEYVTGKKEVPAS